MKSPLYLLGVSLVLFASTGVVAATLTKGPYLQDLRQDGLVVVWETDTSSAGVLEFGLTAEYGTASASSPGDTHHEVRLTGLAAATEYHYRINVDGQPSGKVGSFVTAPSDKVPFTFLVYGDTRSDHNAHALVVSRMMQHQGAFIINTGDMVGSGEVEEDWDTFFEVEADQIRNTVLWPTIGNHEEDNGEAPPPYLRLLVPPESGEDHPTYYSFDYSNSHFIVLDQHAEVEVSVNCIFRIQAFEECLSEAQFAWLKEDLGAANADPDVDHVFIITHIGPYSSKKGRSGSAQMRALLPMFADNKVSMILSGHDHYYEHGLTSNGLQYVITGGGGAPLYETQGTVGATPYPHKILVSTSVHNFQTIYVAGKHLDVVSYEADGSELDAFQIGPKPECVSADDCLPYDTGSCEGEWSCNANLECQWVCDAPKSCITGDECGEPPGDRCQGQWECLDNTCQWACNPEPDCVKDEDCLGRDGLTDCEMGYFACVNDMCEWTCPPIREEDTGPVIVPDTSIVVDSGLAPDPGAGGDGGGTCSQGGAPVPVGGLSLLFVLMLAVLGAGRFLLRSTIND